MESLSANIIYLEAKGLAFDYILHVLKKKTVDIEAHISELRDHVSD